MTQDVDEEAMFMHADADNAILMHYASKYYDPEKARAYYLRTRELKGSQPALETQAQKETWAVANDSIRTERKNEKDAATKAQQAKLENIRKTAEDAKSRILENLKKFFEEVDTGLRIPTNASPKLRAFLEKQNAQQKRTAKKRAVSELRGIATSLRDALTKARDEYKDVQKNLDAKYKADAEREYENIRTKVQ